MEIMLQTVIIVFMLFLCSLCLFAVLVIARDMVSESMGKRKSSFAVMPSEPKEQIIKEVTVIKEVPVEKETPAVAETAKEPEISELVLEPEVAVCEAVEQPMAEPELTVAVVDDENSVKFSTTQLTMDEKYAMLSKEYKGYFNEIVKHALAKEGTKQTQTRNYYDYKIGLTRLVRMSIKRGEIVCEYVFIDRDFKDYASRADLKLKSSATAIKVTDPAAVGVAKDGIDLVYQQYLEDKEYKKQQARERRRAKRQSQNAEENASPEKELVNV